MASSSLMAPQNLIFRGPNFLSPRNSHSLCLPSPPKPHPFLTLSKPTSPSLLSLPNPQPLARSLRKSKLFASSSPPSSSPTIPNDAQTPLAGSTRTITTLFAIALSVSNLIASKLCGFELPLKGVCASPSFGTLGPLFFAKMNPDRATMVRLNTPLSVVVVGMAKWLHIYSGVLLVRVLLSWFPNIPWDRQPMSAIRDLCDPFLNLFRGVIPPLFNTLDISPMLAFSVLGVLASFLKSSSGVY
ncbi:ylmG homolog protein 1-2, chloroplastic-like [Actinidia eriantha]|uniref:ylmG homolog protein 1-2, chloroplastic-like n=1 Tax=Actinidia eriantha TaxID=165200 RepID=UPI00258A8A99|nr:ylmG homolog protein 1-2, chloroplastic-like [Actinidia eriantha]